MSPLADARRRPRIAAVLPNRNHAHYLSVSLGALVAQTRPFDEIIVVDDESTDDSRDVIRALGKTCPTIRLVENARRLGVAGAVEKGVAATDCDYIVMASADERVEATICETMEGALSVAPDARLAVSMYSDWYAERDEIVTYDRDSDLGMWYLRADEPEFVDPERLHALLAERFVWLSMNSSIIHRETLLEIGVFDQRLAWHSDWFAIYTIAFRHGFVAIPRPLSLFRVDEGSYSGRGMSDRAAQARVMRAILAKSAEPGFEDIGRDLARSPNALSPMMRPMLRTLLRDPRLYGRAAPILRWWLMQAVALERPAVLRRLKRRLLGGAHGSRLRDEQRAPVSLS